MQQNIRHNGLPDSPVFNSEMTRSITFCKFAFTYLLGNGERIRFWDNRWRGVSLDAQFPNLYTYALDTNISVKEVAYNNSVNSLFRNGLSDIAQEEIVRLQQLLAGLTLDPLTPDVIIWPWNESRTYTVRGGYRTMKNIPRIKDKARKIWKLDVPPRMKVFGWLMLLNKLFTIDNLNKRGWSIVNRCVMCKVQSESIKHMFDNSIFSKAVYADLRTAIPERIPITNELAPMEMMTSNKISRIQKSTMLITQFCIWRERCNRTFTEETKQVRDIRDEVLWQLQFYSDRTTRIRE